MKNIWKYITVAVAAVAVFACTPSYPEISQGSIPQASDFKVKIDVDQETNMVTFNLENQGMIPIWIFGSDQLIDGKQNKKYSYTGNGVQLRFREAGTYSVEVKAYNTYGTSVGSVVEKFTLDNTYRDPFDPTPYIRAVSGGASQDWVWNSTENGHFGCGPAGNPLAWWSCEANGKDGFLYDDVMTFDSEGKYTFTPADGMAYANKGSEYSTESKTADEDYLFPVETSTFTYTFENEWNEEGIEQIYLVLESGAILSYVPHKSIVESPRYLVMEKTTANMKKKLQLMATVYTPDNTDGISWYYEFVPEGSSEGGDEPVVVEPLDLTQYDLDGETNLWKAATITPELWYSPADWSGGITADYTINADNGITVTIPDGIGGGEWQGQTKLKSGIASSSDKKYDLSVTLLADEDMTVTIKLTNDPEENDDIHSFFYDGQVKLVAGEPLVYRRSNLSQSVSGDNVMLIFDFGRSPIGSTITASDIIFQEHREATNLWAGATINPELWYSPADWSGGITADYTINADNGITVTIPEGIGGGEWQGQTKLKSGIASSSDKTYALSVELLADEDMTVTIKLTNDPEENDDIHSFFYDGQVQLTAGESLLYVKRGLKQSVSGDNVMLIFDFGRSPIGSTITASNIIFIEE